MARFTETRRDSITGDLYQNHGHKTRFAASLRIVIGAEAAFWRAALVAAKPADTIFFRELARRGIAMELRTRGHFESNSRNSKPQQPPPPRQRA